MKTMYRRILIVGLVFFSIYSYSDNIIHSEILVDDHFTEHEIPDESSSGIYYMHGTRIDLRYAFPWPQWGGDVNIVKADTSHFVFTLYVNIPEEKPDSVQFFGLQGANAGWPHAKIPDCTGLNDDNCVYAKNIDGELEFEMRTPGGAYSGIGSLIENVLTLDTYFEYRGIGTYYIVEGRKIEGIEM